MGQNTTTERILDAAEALFAEHGFDGTSLRAVPARAEVNLAAVHYHFGSKMGLFRALVERRVGEVNRARLDTLDELQRSAAPAAAPLEDVVRAFLAPAFAHLDADDPGLRAFLQIVGRLHSSRGDHVDAVRDVFAEVSQRFLAALGAALPEVPASVLAWRLHFVISAMCTQMADPERIRLLASGDASSDDALDQLLAFSVAGLRAPVPSASPR